jgi:hypothetical protein
MPRKNSRKSQSRENIDDSTLISVDARLNKIPPSNKPSISKTDKSIEDDYTDTRRKRSKYRVSYVNQDLQPDPILSLTENNYGDQ